MKHHATSARSRFWLGASLGAMAVGSGPALAQSCPADQPCDLTVTQANQSLSIGAPGGHVVNQAIGTTIAVGVASGVVIDNRAGASIAGFTSTAPVPQPPQPFVPLLVRNPGVTLINAGSITGNVLFAGGDVYVNAGGSVSGNVGAANPNSTTSETYINRGGGSIGGQINVGLGVDSFLDSISASAQMAIPATRPSGFEIYGIEVLGSGTTATVVNASGSAASAGLSLRGNGAVVNRAVIDEFDLSGSGLPAFVLPLLPRRAVGYAGVTGETDALTIAYPVNGGGFPLFLTESIPVGGALESFTNEGTINGDLLLVTAAFTNSSAINLRSAGAGTIISGAANRDFTFVNTGAIAMADNGVRANPLFRAAVSVASAPDTTTPARVSILNGTAGAIWAASPIRGWRASSPSRTAARSPSAPRPTASTGRWTSKSAASCSAPPGAACPSPSPSRSASSTAARSRAASRASSLPGGSRSRTPGRSRPTRTIPRPMRSICNCLPGRTATSRTPCRLPSPTAA
jgi:hypothetical protein